MKTKIIWERKLGTEIINIEICNINEIINLDVGGYTVA